MFNVWELYELKNIHTLQIFRAAKQSDLLRALLVFISLSSQPLVLFTSVKEFNDVLPPISLIRETPYEPRSCRLSSVNHASGRRLSGI